MKIIINNFIGHLKTIIIHKYWVFYYACKLGIPIQGLLHDMSKFSPIEFWESIKYYQGGKSSPINACKADKGYSLAWQHHKGRNPHHYEYWVDKLDEGGIAINMPSKYKLEMLADYLAAGRVYMKEHFSYLAELKWYEEKQKSPRKIHKRTDEFMFKALLVLYEEDGSNAGFKIVKELVDLFKV